MNPTTKTTLIALTVLLVGLLLAPSAVLGQGAENPSDPTAGGTLIPIEPPDAPGPLPGIQFPGAPGVPSELPVVYPEVPLGVVGTYNFEEPLIRVNPTNPANIVATSHRGMRITTDGGATFGPLITFPDVGIGNNGDTAMDFDSQGRLFWANLTGGPGHNQIAQFNPFTGAQIGVTVDVAVAGGVPATTGDDKEFLAADYTGGPFTDNLYMIWTRFPGGPSEVFFSRSTDQAVTWSVPIQFSNNGVEGFPWPADVNVAPNGDVYAAYHAGGQTGAVGTTWVLRSTDGGVTFPQKNLAFTAGQSDVTFNVQSGAGTIPLTQFWMQGSAQPWVLPDPVRPGNVYVVNNDDPDNVHGAGDDADVVISRSTDNGLTWTVTKVPDGSAGAHQVFPFAAIDETNGNIAVAWYDTRRGLTNANGNLLLDVFATFSTDGGLTWATAFMINDPNNPFDPDFPGNQRRFPTPQITPCDATPGSTETCRMGEYFGIDIRGSVMHLDWIGNTRGGPGPGNVTGDQLFYSQVRLAVQDIFEPNESLAEASVLGSLPQITLNDLNIHNASDVDWFKITAPATGKMIINALFPDAVGDLDIQVTDMGGNNIVTSASTTDNEQIVIPVVNQEMYFLRVYGFAGATNFYDLEIETFAAPKPTLPDLGAASDTGMMNDDNVTADNTPTFFVQADLQSFADMGIAIDPGMGAAGADVVISATSLATGTVTMIDAPQVSPANPNLWTGTFAAPLADDQYFIEAWVRITDGQLIPVVGRGMLSEPLSVTIDTVSPAVSPPDLLSSSDSGMEDFDDVTNKMQPAFSGNADPNSKVRVFADGLLVGQGVATFGGAWEITVEPLTDGTRNITTVAEDLAGNVSPPSAPLTIWIDTAVPNTPLLNVLDASDSGPFNDDDITNDSTPTLEMTGNDTVGGGPNLFPNDVKFRLYDRPESGPGEVLLFDSFVTFAGFVTFEKIFFTPGVQAEGLHDLKLEIEDRAGNVSPDFLLPVVIDTVDPMDPGGVTITSHTLGVPSQEMVIDAEWTAGSDANSGLFGYAYEFNNTAVATCDELKDLDPTITEVSSLPLADDSWWFHICTGDLAGNWTSTVVVGDAIIDTVPPKVSVVNSVADTGDGMLADFEATPTPITQVVLTFDEAMADPAGDTDGDDVTNPINYLLVRAGFNEVIETTTCQDGAAGDDIEIVINEVIYHAPSMTGHLVVNNGFSLDEDAYRIFFCGTNSMSSASVTFGLEDIAENDFDGDGDGVGGDDQLLDFDVTESNLLRNPNFDDDLAAWIPLTPADTTFDAGSDAGMVVNSGSAALASGAGGANEALSQCVFPLGEDRKFSFGSQANIASGSATDPIQSIMVDFFQTGDCSGAVLATATTSSVVGDTAGAFSPDMGETTAPGSAGSALVTYLVDGMSGPAPPYTVNLDSVFLYGTPTPVAMAVGDVDGDGTDDLAADFGAMGIWVYYSGGGTPFWAPITPLTSDGGMVIGDLDGTGMAEVVVDFGSMGMWAWSNNAAWFQMTPFNAGAMTAADVDGNGNDEVIAEFAELSVWISFNYVSWMPLSPEIANRLATGDVDNNGREDVIADFGPKGLWIYRNNLDWIAISTEKVGPGGIAAADTNGDGLDEVVADFGPQGVWLYDTLLGWSPRSVANPEGFAAGDVNNNSIDELYFDLGANRGIWQQVDGFVPATPLVFLNPDAIATGDLNANGMSDLIVDFGDGPGLGLWVLFDNVTWMQLTPMSP